jgi:hypothetical protein
MTESKNIPEHDPWSFASFEGNEREQLQRWAKTSLIEKVRWLEEAQRLSRVLERSRRTARPIVPQRPEEPHC